VLPDVAQERQHRLVAGPVQVVHHDRPGRRVVEVDEPLQLAAHPLGPLRHRVEVVERALPDVARVADHAGGPAGQHDRAVTGALEPAQA
jgi:hypothetical protein